MIRALALLLSRIAQRALPPGREEWCAAIGAEVENVEGRLARLSFSASCLRAALKERARHGPSVALAGLWSVALLTAALALFQLGCAVRGATIVLGAPDPYLQALLNGTPTERAIGGAYHAATPALVACLAGLALTQLVGACLLACRRWRPFVLASWVALATCVLMAFVITWVGLSSPSLALQFAALILQAVVVPLLCHRVTPRHPLSSAGG
jgi:hypothetical protein